MNLRFARQEDVPGLLAIYEYYIPTNVTFEYVLPSKEEFSRRVASTSAIYPYLAAVEGERLLGYAYAHQIAERAAYHWGAELSIYLSPPRRGGKGAGPAAVPRFNRTAAPARSTNGLRSGGQSQPGQRGAAPKSWVSADGHPAQRRIQKRQLDRPALV